MKEKLGKKTKTLCIVFGMLLLAAVCVYCFHGKKAQKAQKVQEAQKDRSVSYTDMAVSYSTIGCFYGDDQHRLLYLDADSGKETLVCAKAGCEHQSHEENANTECAADIYGVSDFVGIIQQGQYVYFLYRKDYDLTDYALYRQNLDGSERKKIMVLKDTEALLPSRMVCDGKWLVISFEKTYQKDEKTGEMVDLEERDFVLVVVNLEEKAYANYSIRKQCPAGSTNCYVSSISIEGDELYFLCGYTDADYQMEQAAKMDSDTVWKYEAEHRQGDIWKLSMKNGNIQPVWAGDKLEEVKFDGAKLLFQRNQSQITGYADLSKGEKVNVKEIPSLGDNTRIEGIAGEDLYYRKYDADSDSTTYYVYHLETDEEESIAEPPEHYSLNYLSERYAFFSVFDENDEITNYSGHVACLSLQDFKEGNYAEVSGQ